MATKDTGEEETQDEVDATPSSSDGEGNDKGDGDVEEAGPTESPAQVPEQFQQEATALVEQCDNVHCLDFLMNLVTEMRQKLMSSQKSAGLNKDDFSDKDMPSE